MNETIMRQLGFGDKVDLIKRGLCPSCKQSVGKFRDEVSRREYCISGFCQACQDKTFVEPKDPCGGCMHVGTNFCQEECPI